MHRLCFVVFLADRTVQEQCCVTVIEDNMCTTGRNMAKEQGSCYSLFANTCKTKTAKVCLLVQICSCLCALLTKKNVNRDKTVGVKSRCAPKISLYQISLHYIILLDCQYDWERWCAFVSMFVRLHWEQDEACHSREDWSLLLSEIINSALTLGSSIRSRPTTFHLFYFSFFQRNPRFTPLF